MALLLQLSERSCDASELCCRQRLYWRRIRRVLRGGACLIHRLMAECPRQILAHGDSVPICTCFLYKQVEYSIIGRRNGSPKAGLLWILGFLSQKQECLVKQILGECHKLHPAWILEM